MNEAIYIGIYIGIGKGGKRAHQQVVDLLHEYLLT